MTEIHQHIDARMADYIRTHPYIADEEAASPPGRPSPPASVAVLSLALSAVPIPLEAVLPAGCTRRFV